MNKPNQVFLDEKQRLIKRGLKLKCSICSLPFGILRKQHICKRCLRSVCSDDSPFKKKQFQIFNDGKDHRLCKQCQEQQQCINQYLIDYQVQFGSDSLIIKKLINSLDKKYLNKLKIVNDFTVKRQFINLQNLMKSLNASFRLFLGKAIMKSGKKLSQIADLINWALSQILTIRAGTINQISFILLFFFAHSTLQTAIFLTIQTLKIISEIRQFSEQQIIQQVFQIIEYKKQQQNLTLYLNSTIKKLINGLTLNQFNILISSQILIQTLNQKNKYPFLSGLGFVVSESTKYFQNNSLQEKSLQLSVQRSSTLIAKSKKFRFDYSFVKKKQKKYLTKLQNQLEILKKQYGQIQKKFQVLQKQNIQLKNILKDKQAQLLLLIKQRRTSQKSLEKQQRIKKNNSFSSSKSICKCMSEKHYHEVKKKSVQQVDTSMLQLLKQKNDQIRRLSQLLNDLKTQNTFLINKQQFSSQINKDEQKTNKQKNQIMEQNQNLKKINASLLQKLAAITTKIMDDEQQQIKSSNRWFSQYNDKNVANEQCVENGQCVQTYQNQDLTQKQDRKTSSSSSIKKVFPSIQIPKIKKWGIFKYLD